MRVQMPYRLRAAGGRQRQVRQFPLELRAIGDAAGGAGQFTGYASVFGVQDSYGTVFGRGCFQKTISEHQGRFPILWMHNP